MTPSQQARRSDSLYFGEPTRREICDMVAHREARIEELESELAKLRKEVEHGKDTSG